MQVRKQQLELDMNGLIANRERSMSRLYIDTLLFHYILSTSREMLGWVEVQVGIKTARRNINNLRCTDDTTLTAETEEELKSLLMKLKEECERAGLKFNVHKTKIIASGPITSWQIDGETMETVADFILGGSKSLQMVTAAMKLKDAYSLEGKL